MPAERYGTKKISKSASRKSTRPQRRQQVARNRVAARRTSKATRERKQMKANGFNYDGTRF